MALVRPVIGLRRLLSSFGDTLLLATLLAVGLTLPGNAANKTVLGMWEINDEETIRLRPKQSNTTTSGGGFGSVVVVGGVLLPGPDSGGNTPTVAGQGAGLPRVLSCRVMQLDLVGETINMTCDGETKPRKFTIGKLHGRKTKFSQKKLTEGYTSTTRRVEHKFSIKKQDRLHVEVSVKPKGGKRLRYLVVFDRQLETPS